VEITWLGHSCFRLRQDDLVVVTDPFTPSLGLSMEPVEALAVSVSHDHPNHNNVSALQGSPRVLRGPGEYEIQGIHIRGFLTPPAEDDPPDARNTAFVLKMGGLTVCHLGDIRQALPATLVAELDPLDILLVPVGGTCTLGIPQVSELVRSLGPRLVIPMHYKLPGLPIEIEPLETFLREMGIREATTQARLVVSPSTLPEETRIVVLEALGQPTAAGEEAS
jgi:L-ascorbate metabolism protein UlaG (beta-lactamase superfamily)